MKNCFSIRNIQFESATLSMKKKHPNCFFSLETILRTKYFGRDALYMRQKKIFFSKPIVNILAYYYLTIYYLLKSLIKKEKRDYYLDLRRYVDLNDMLSHELPLTLSVRNYKNSTYKLKDILFFKYHDYKSLLLRGKANSLILDILESNDFEKIITHSRLVDLECLIETEISKAVRWLKMYEFKSLILIEDQEPRTRILIMAARKLGIEVNVFCHGYIQDPLFITILPLFADRIFVWDSSQEKMLMENGLNKEQVYSFGYPKSIIRKGGQINSFVLIVMEPVTSLSLNNSDILNLYKCYVREIAKRKKVVVRPHPKEVSSAIIFNSLGNIENVEISNSELASDLLSSSCVIGSNSSVLVEALYYGKNSFQIGELAKFTFPGVKKISLSNIKDLELDSISSEEFESYIDLRRKVQTLIKKGLI
ncbi:hypothetical protein QFW85_03975 [Vibrio chagasii]|uniref:hypothetical protein n=1 Tax=Vibrio chagasii TaxID=170679 RepID=UPI003DA89759